MTSEMSGADEEQPNNSFTYFRDICPEGKGWDENRAASDHLALLYSGTKHDQYAGRIKQCALHLVFDLRLTPEEGTGELRPKLRLAHFCHQRNCVICQARRSLIWRARFLDALPGIIRDYPSAQFVFLTLTVRNPLVQNLRSTLKLMNSAWKRLIERKDWPALGFIRATEITRERDSEGNCTDYVHPHFHCILMVCPSYFTRDYISQLKWRSLWQECLRVDYDPRVDIRAIRPKKKKQSNPIDEPQVVDKSTYQVVFESGLMDAVVETLKYSTEGGDLIGLDSYGTISSSEESIEGNKQFLVKYTDQVHRMRFIALGGVFKKYISETEPEDLLHEADQHDDEKSVIHSQLAFFWKEIHKRYYLKD